MGLQSSITALSQVVVNFNRSFKAEYSMNIFVSRWVLGVAPLLMCASLWASQSARPIASRISGTQWEPSFAAMSINRARALDEPGDLVDWLSTMDGAGLYLRQLQADVTEDNAGNGVSGVNESPDDPDDGGWDWVLNWNTDPLAHSINSSPRNLYGPTALGVYHAYLRTGDPSLWTAMLDAANEMIAPGSSDIRTSGDMQFLILFDDLYDTVVGPTSVYSDGAKLKYDARILEAGSATLLASTIRDVRGVTQGYPNGLIGWDIGNYAVVAQLLYERYGAPYDQDADDIAEVLWQDSFNDNPGLFDVVDDAGWDPDYADVNFWWYTLGVTGLLDAFNASGTHASDIPFLTQRLLDSQYGTGAFSFSYGANSADEDWQSSAYSVMSLNTLDSVVFKTEIGNGAYWIAATQHAGGGWVYGNGEHYPEIGSENTCAVSKGFVPDEIWVDDNWTNQADVDLYNSVNNLKLVWGYTAFSSMPVAMSAMANGTIHLLAGVYLGQIHPIGYTNFTIIGAGPDSTIIRAPNTTMPHIYFAGGPNRPILFIHSSTAHISNLTIDGNARGANNSRMIGVAFWNSAGSLDNVRIINVRDTPLNGNQQGVGISVNHNDANQYYVSVNNVTISGFQKNGTSFTGAGTTVDCDSLNVVGLGPTTIVVQNGIQYSSGAVGTVTNSAVSGITWTGAVYVASSILLFQAATVDISNTSTTNGQAGVYSIDTDGSITSGRFEASSAPSSVAKVGVRLNSSASALAQVANQPQVYEDQVDSENRGGGSALDDNETFTITDVEIVGDAATGSVGLYAYVDGGNLNLSFTNSEVTNWARGVDLSRVGSGTIATATVIGNKLTNTANSFDNTSGHFWDSNCYSDYAANFGFPGSYEIPGAVVWNVDQNPNPNGCSDLNLFTANGKLGCANTECDVAPLYLTLSKSSIPNLQLTVQLPANMVAELPVEGAVVTPSSNADTNLIQAFAINLGSGLVQVDIGFEGTGSVGDFNKYIACIPVRNLGQGTGEYGAVTMSSLWIDQLGGQHAGDMSLGATGISVDCTPPTITSFNATPTCAFGHASQTEGMFSAGFSDAASNLASAWVTASPGGGSCVVFDGNLPSPQMIAFPSAADTTAFFDILTDGCNTLTLHMMDSECNEAPVVMLGNVSRDTTAPSLSLSAIIPPEFCFNNDTTSDHYGGTLLDDFIHVSSTLDTGSCHATTGSLVFSHPGLTDLVLNLNVTSYPANNTEAQTLWTWMLGYPLLAGADGDTFTFDVKATDCSDIASEVAQFSICVDNVVPENTFTHFDAHPAHNGVWLNWSWEAGANAQEMRIYRSPHSTEYPAYPNDQWNNPAEYNVSTMPPLGWTLVAAQTGPYGTVTSAAYSDQNNRGDVLTTHVEGSETFWLEAESSWSDGNENSSAYRDVYRYVTFVRDAGGNWSIGDTVSVLQNADRATNYWLGDFSTADAVGDTHSRGRVDTDDLSLLSAVYFTTTGGYRNIGPVVVENGGTGKGLPDPDPAGMIDFDDLVPFSFNFGVVSPVGITTTEFAILPNARAHISFQSLDNVPSVSISTDAQLPASIGSEFKVLLNLTGNEQNSVKAVEVKLDFDESMLEYIGSTGENVRSPDGTIFTKTSLIGSDGVVGMVAASCGGRSTLEGDATLAEITFKVKSELSSNCEIELTSVKLLDSSGEVRVANGEAVRLFGGSEVVEVYQLYQNYPNPFNPTTTLQFGLKDAGHVTIKVHNTLGQLVSVVADQEYESGVHRVSFDAADLASGVYIYSISVNGFTDLKKMVLIR